MQLCIDPNLAVFDQLTKLSRTLSAELQVIHCKLSCSEPIAFFPS